MAVISSAGPALSGDLELFHTTDPLLYNSPVVVFYGPAASITSASSRIQVHVFTPAGLESYTRLAISPASPHYAAVNALPREEQGDEVCRGIAFALSKYFTDIPKSVRDSFVAQAGPSNKSALTSGLFTPAHIAVLASRMTRCQNSLPAIQDIQRALGEATISWLDLDVVLPPGSIKASTGDNTNPQEPTEHDLSIEKYGRYAAIVENLGEPAFLPTSKLRRAPSKPTVVGRSQTFRQDQKEIVRKEMCELVDTEENYLHKLDDLQKIAADFKDRPTNDAIPVVSAADRAIEELFPASLDRMLMINTAFLAEIRAILDSTEETAIDDIQSTDSGTALPKLVESDSLGIVAFSKCLLDWLPKFAADYPQYMQSNSRVPSRIRQLSRSHDAELTSKMQDIGEQRLMSLLIEPIQRLPRYTLYIDTISKQLPLGHIAQKSLLKARDMISEICTQDSADLQRADLGRRASQLIQDWPDDMSDLGRLVTIADTTELEAPYDPSSTLGTPGLLLLFTTCTVFVEKLGSTAMSARSLLTELEKLGDAETGHSLRPRTPSSLRFVEAFDLHRSLVSECIGGRAISVMHMSSTQEKSSKHPTRMSVFGLETIYADKASKLIEEMAKARVERRFDEAERENGVWDVRAAVTGPGELNLFSAIFEDSNAQRDYVGSTRLVVEPERCSNIVKLGDQGVDTIIAIRSLHDKSLQVTIDDMTSGSSRDKITVEELLPLLSRRLTAILQTRFSVRNPAVASTLIAQHHAILQSLNLVTGQGITGSERSQQTNGHTHTHRPISPVKMLHNLLTPQAQPSSLPTQSRFAMSQSSLHGPPKLAPPASQAVMKEPGRQEIVHAPAAKSPELATSEAPISGRFGRLEDILSTYLLALQARKGNVVGRTIKARRGADELAVNELYNSLLEDPNMMVLAAQASVDVLFMAFEKFLNVAWQEKLGAVITSETMSMIQTKAETAIPADFRRYFESTLSNMAPQNQRALRGIVKLLAELLDGTGNDGDRGILTAAFTELLVPDKNPYDFVSLLDRFVEDIEPLFGESVQVREVAAAMSSTNGHERARSVNSASLTSNTSSLRKKFGLGGLSRENSKSEQESKVGSVWRTLSKSKAPEQPSSISRGTIQRAKSTDIDTRLATKRPTSQDRPASTLGPFSFERPQSQDKHSLMPGSPLGTIGEDAAPQSTGPPRKKRRSSLSDLKGLQSATTSPVQSPPAVRRLDLLHHSRTTSQDSPLTSLTKAFSSTPLPSPGAGSPTRNLPRSRLPSAFRKENSPGAAQSPASSLPRPRSSSTKPEEVTITAHSSVRRTDSVSGVPTLLARKTSTNAAPVRNGLSERPSAGNAMKVKSLTLSEKTITEETTTLSPAMTSTPTKKLRVQSPQKLRERLQLEQRAITSTSSLLETELSKISDEISALGPGRMGSVRLAAAARQPPSSSPTSANDLTKRLNDLQTQLSSTLSDLTTRTTAIQSDLASSLTVSEAKCRKLDELYREANAENEMMYDKFNGELQKVLGYVKAGQGVEELRKRVKEEQDEAGRLRRENARLKRENLGLRSQLRD